MIKTCKSTVFLTKLRTFKYKHFTECWVSSPQSRVLERRVIDIAPVALAVPPCVAGCCTSLGTRQAPGALAGVAGTCTPSLDAPDATVTPADASGTCAPSLDVLDALVALATTAGICSPFPDELLTCGCRRVTIFPLYIVKSSPLERLRNISSCTHLAFTCCFLVRS